VPFAKRPLAVLSVALLVLPLSTLASQVGVAGPFGAAEASAATCREGSSYTYVYSGSRSFAAVPPTGVPPTTADPNLGKPGAQCASWTLAVTEHANTVARYQIEIADSRGVKYVWDRYTLGSADETVYNIESSTLTHTNFLVYCSLFVPRASGSGQTCGIAPGTMFGGTWTVRVIVCALATTAQCLPPGDGHGYGVATGGVDFTITVF